MNPSSMNMQQKIQWLKQNGVSDQEIQQRLSGGSTTPPTQTPAPQENMVDKYSSKIPEIMSAIGGLLPGGLGAGAAGAANLGGSAIANSIQDIANTPKSQARRKKVAQGDLSEPLEQIKQASFASAGNVAGQGFGKILSKLGSSVFKLGVDKTKRIADEAVKKTVKYGEKPLEEKMIEKGTRGTAQQMLKQAYKGMDDAWNSVKKVVSPDKKIVDVASIEDDFLKQMTDPELGASTLRLGKEDEIIGESAKMMANIKKQYGNKLSLKDIVELNKQANEKGWTAAGNEKPMITPESRAWEMLDNFIKKYIQTSEPKVASALNDYGYFSDLEDMTLKTANRTPLFKISNPLQAVSLPFKIPQIPYFATNVGAGAYNLGKSGAPGALGSYLGGGNNETR